MKSLLLFIYFIVIINLIICTKTNPITTKRSKVSTKSITSSSSAASSSSTTSTTTAKTLLIVESPAKAGTIEKILGSNYKVLSSFGHIREIDKSVTVSNKIDFLHGIDLKNDYKPTYAIMDSKRKLIDEICENLNKNKYEKVLLASDKDREGESIAWHLAEVLKLNTNECNRITFNEITLKALMDAINNPRKIDMSLVRSQEARVIIDRLLGFEVSLLLIKYTSDKNVSAGRVMSVVMKLILEKEKEINKFLSSQYYKVRGLFGKNSNAVCNKNFQSREEVINFLEDLNSKNNIYTIVASEKSTFEKKPPSPFILSTAVKEITSRFSISSELAGSILQGLYENGHISYHRTDNPNLSSDFRSAVKLFVEERFGVEYFQNRTYQSKSKSAQEAHEGIRPTEVNRIQLDKKDDLESKVYQLIWKRAVSSQLANAVYDLHTVSIQPSTRREQFIFKRTSTSFDGYTVVYDIQSTDDDSDNDDSDSDSDSDDINEDLLGNIIESETVDLTKLKIGSKVNNILINSTEILRKAPSHFTEGALIKKMEDIGVGRPSTYVNVIKKLFTRDYISKQNIKGKSKNMNNLVLKDGIISENKINKVMGSEKNVLVPTIGADITNSFLEKNFEDLINYKYTANLEDQLDKIASSEVDRTTILNNFYHNFKKRIVDARNVIPESNIRILGSNTNGETVSLFVSKKYGPTLKVGSRNDTNIKYYNVDIDLNRVEDFSLEEALQIIISSKSQTNTVTYKDQILVIKPPIKGKNTYFFEYLGQLYPVLAEFDPMNISQLDISKCIESKNSKVLYNFEEFMVLDGKFGPYISIPAKNTSKTQTKSFTYISINSKIYDITKITKSDCLDIINNKMNKKQLVINDDAKVNAENLPPALTDGDNNIVRSKKKITGKKMKLYDQIYILSFKI